MCCVQVVFLFIGGDSRVILCPRASLMIASSPGVVVARVGRILSIGFRRALKVSIMIEGCVQ